jgi:hypothetical protein
LRRRRRWPSTNESTSINICSRIPTPAACWSSTVATAPSCGVATAAPVTIPPQPSPAPRRVRTLSVWKKIPCPSLLFSKKKERCEFFSVDGYAYAERTTPAAIRPSRPAGGHAETDGSDAPSAELTDWMGYAVLRARACPKIGVAGPNIWRMQRARKWNGGKGKDTVVYCVQKVSYLKNQNIVSLCP